LRKKEKTKKDYNAQEEEIAKVFAPFEEERLGIISIDVYFI